MGWRIFAVFLSLFTVIATIGLFRAPFEATVVISYLVSIPANVGMVLFAFGKEPRPSAFWTIFSWLFALWAIACIVRTIAKYPQLDTGHFGVAPLMMALLISGAFYFFQWLGLRRLSLGMVA